jgi:hypothetical protein
MPRPYRTRLRHFRPSNLRRDHEGSWGSGWGATILDADPDSRDGQALRLGLGLACGLPAEAAEQIVAEHDRHSLYRDLPDVAHRLDRARPRLEHRPPRLVHLVRLEPPPMLWAGGRGRDVVRLGLGEREPGAIGQQRRLKAVIGTFARREMAWHL